MNLDERWGRQPLRPWEDMCLTLELEYVDKLINRPMDQASHSCFDCPLWDKRPGDCITISERNMDIAARTWYKERWRLHVQPL